MGTLWSCLFYLSFILTLSRCSELAKSNSTGQSNDGGTTQLPSILIANSSKDAQPLANLTSTTNYTTEGRSRGHMFLRSGNELWDGLVDDCLYKPSFSCFQKNVFVYLDNTLKLEDVNVTDRLLFKKIDVNASRIESELEAENEILEEEEAVDEERSGKISIIFHYGTYIFYYCPRIM